MSKQFDSAVGNKRVSEQLRNMLVDLRNSTVALNDNIKEIEVQARYEGFKNKEIDMLIRDDRSR
jgi:hypothetical protein